MRENINKLSHNGLEKSKQKQKLDKQKVDKKNH